MRGPRWLLAVFLVLSIAGSLLPARTARASEPKVLRSLWGDGVPDSFEPQSNDFGIGDLTLLVYEGLTRFDEHLNVVPGAAESWEFNDDGTAITYTLREHLTYSDGTPVTAERFKYAIARRCDPRLTVARAEFFYDVVGCQELHDALEGVPGPPGDIPAELMAALGVYARDERTLEIQLTHPAPYFPTLTHWIGFIPVQQERILAGGAEWWRDEANWVGNGPFELQEIATEGENPHVSVVANERYWGGRPKLDGITLMVMDFNAALAAYQRGELEATWPPFDDLARLEADPQFSRHLVRMPSPDVNPFLLNANIEPFSDKRVREAFAYAFDREAYCREILRGTCTPLLSWMPPMVPGAIETDAYAFDPDAARAALAASSYGGPERLPEITWYFDGSDAWSNEQAAWVSEQFRQVLGVELTLAPVTWEEVEAMQDNPATYPQIADTYWWADPVDPHGWLQFWTCGNEWFTVKIGYCNPAFDDLAARSDAEMDPVARIRLTQAANEVLVADAPAIFGYYGEQIGLMQPYVIGFERGAPYQGFPGIATPLTLDIAPH